MSVPSLGTSTFTPPDGCLDTYYASSTKDGFAYVFGPENNYSRCFPPGWTEAPKQYYSPAVNCPEGYVSACSSTNGNTETVVTCCPSGFLCQVPDPTPFLRQYATLSCTQAFTGPIQATTVQLFFSSSLIGYHTVPESETGGMNAYSVQIRYQAKDLTATPTPSSTQAQPASSSAIPTTTKATQAPATITVVAAHSLSKSSIIAIAVVVLVVVLALLFGIFVYFRRTRERGFPDPPGAPAYHHVPKAELSGNQQFSPRSELVGNSPCTPGTYSANEGGQRELVGNLHELSGTPYIETTAPVPK